MKSALNRIINQCKTPHANINFSLFISKSKNFESSHIRHLSEVMNA